jgi:hypothetical protein
MQYKLVAGSLSVVLHPQRLPFSVVVGIQVPAGFLNSNDVADHRISRFSQLGLIRDL